jgi:lactoylglutathione lyase
MNPPRLQLVVIRSTDISRVVAFYSKFGVAFEEHRHGTGPGHFSTDLSGLVFEIYPAKKPEDVDRTTRLGFAIPDLHGSILELRSLDVEIIEEPKETEWGLRAVVRDPDGRSVELYAYDSPA